MSCCASNAGPEVAATGTVERATNELLLASREIGDGLHQTNLSVPAIHCGGCIQKIERTIAALPGVKNARVNLSTRRVAVSWRGVAPPPFVETLAAIGYDAHLYDAGADSKDVPLAELVRALAVAGFSAGNIMMLSVAIWSGADAPTRDLFHAISAFIALPALIYSGCIFFRSAWASLRCGRTNMDVPISIGILLAFGLSLYETAHRGPHAYFDAATSLLFFLLVGRTLDHIMREKARAAVKGLARLAGRGALVLRPDGRRDYVSLSEIEPGMAILLTAGERVPVDSEVTHGKSDVDCSLVSGESIPQIASAGSRLQAGTLNLTGPLTIVALAAAKDSFLAEMMRMMEAAETGRSAYRRISDRASRLYAPVVHLTALLTFVGWIATTGDLHRAATIAIAVLIITCPCALALAVPMVHIVAARRLFERGIMVKDGGALERLAAIDTVLFDKTGTLTRGEPTVDSGDAIHPETLALAAAIAAHSRHPYSVALATAGGCLTAPRIALTSVSEYPGAGLEAHGSGHVYRLGRPEWVRAGSCLADSKADVLLSRDGKIVAEFRFRDQLRTGAREAVAQLRNLNIAVEILSGDRAEPVRQLASTLGVPHLAPIAPGEKAAHVSLVQRLGHKALMVGDGLNDGPALVAAYVSMAPASAADVGRNAADLVFLRESLLAVPEAVGIACNAARLVHQNLAFAVAYNVLAVPIAILGYATPLIAAVAMSLSSLFVVANALRLRGPHQHRRMADALRTQSRVQPVSLGGHP
jgi:Cu2+-exporting ATPase